MALHDTNAVVRNPGGQSRNTLTITGATRKLSRLFNDVSLKTLKGPTQHLAGFALVEYAK